MFRSTNIILNNKYNNIYGKNIEHYENENETGLEGTGLPGSTPRDVLPISLSNVNQTSDLTSDITTNQTSELINAVTANQTSELTNDVTANQTSELTTSLSTASTVDSPEEKETLITTIVSAITPDPVQTVKSCDSEKAVLKKQCVIEKDLLEVINYDKQNKCNAELNVITNHRNILIGVTLFVFLLFIIALIFALRKSKSV